MNKVYISFVVTSRNDNHGGDLLRRMQIFVSGLLEQAERFNLPSELIIVEWNPPVDCPPLRDALQWPKSPTSCTVRIVTVPPLLHRKYKYSDKLQLFQMIAKNVGIRRAKGEFIVATNIDLLFSDELIKSLAEQKLDPSALYRIDRYDVRGDVPDNAGIEQQLDYCKRNILRINIKEGTFTTRQMQWLTFVKALRRSRFWGPVMRQLNRIHWIVQWVKVWFPHKVVTKEIFSPQSLKSFFVNRIRLARLFFSTLFSKGRGVALIAPPVNTKWNDYWKHNATSPKPDGTNYNLSQIFAIVEQVHTNACGDFTLLSKEKWTKLQGYPEFEIFSFHLDSLLCLNAYFAGIKEIVIGEPARLYHIEHSSGWTPESEQQLKYRIAKLGIPFMEYEEFLSYIKNMHTRASHIDFNSDQWGLANLEFEEFRLG